MFWLARQLLGTAAVLGALVVALLAATLLVHSFAFGVRVVLPAAVMQGADVTTAAARISFWADRLYHGDPNAEGGSGDRRAFQREARRAEDGDRAIFAWLDRCQAAAAELPVLRQLGAAIWRERIGAAQRAAEAYAELQLLTWLGILIGLITTVLVSISATEFGRGEAATARTIRVLAVVFPVLGTSLAAIAAFYSPREELARASQLLAAMRQSQAAIVLDLAELACPHENDEARARYFAAVRAWSRQVEQARAAAEAATLAALQAGGATAAGQRATPGEGSAAPAR